MAFLNLKDVPDDTWEPFESSLKQFIDSRIEDKLEEFEIKNNIRIYEKIEEYFKNEEFDLNDPRQRALKKAFDLLDNAITDEIKLKVLSVINDLTQNR